MKKILVRIWKPLLMFMPFVLGMAGFSVAGEPTLQAFYASICLYGMGQRDMPPNLLVEIARWIAPLATAGAVVLVFKSLRRYFHDLRARLTAQSVAVRGPAIQKKAMLEVLGSKGIDMENEPVKADNYILLGGEEESLDFYYAHLADIKARVFIQSSSLPSSNYGRNLRLFCPEQIAARVFWEQNCPYELSKAHGHKLDVVLIGFERLGQEVLLQALRNLVFHPEQKIAYHVIGKENGFRQIHNQLHSIGDPVIFYEQPWTECLELVASAHMVIVTEQKDQLALLHALTLAIPKREFYVFSAQPACADLLANEEPEKNAQGAYGAPPRRLVCYDWKKQAMEPRNILQSEALRRAKLFHLYYTGQQGVADADPEALWQELNLFLQASNVALADYHPVVMAILEGRALTDELLEQLAELEHIRWCRYHYLNNWRSVPMAEGVRKNILARTHPCLASYQAMPESYKEYDRENIRIHVQLAQREQAAR